MTPSNRHWLLLDKSAANSVRCLLFFNLVLHRHMNRLHHRNFEPESFQRKKDLKVHLSH